MVVVRNNDRKEMKKLIANKKIISNRLHLSHRFIKELKDLKLGSEMDLTRYMEKYILVRFEEYKSTWYEKRRSVIDGRRNVDVKVIEVGFQFDVKAKDDCIYINHPDYYSFVLQYLMKRAAYYPSEYELVEHEYYNAPHEWMSKIELIKRLRKIIVYKKMGKMEIIAYHQRRFFESIEIPL